MSILAVVEGDVEQVTEVKVDREAEKEEKKERGGGTVRYGRHARWRRNEIKMRCCWASQDRRRNQAYCMYCTLRPRTSHRRAAPAFLAFLRGS